MAEIKCMKCGSNKLYAQTEALRESFQAPGGGWVEAKYLNTAGKAHVYCLECYDEWWMNIKVMPKIMPLLNQARNALRWVHSTKTERVQKCKDVAERITKLIGED